MFKYIIITIFFVQCCFALTAQNHSKALAAADTTNFSINKKENWKLYNSYLSHINEDSVMIELILQHDTNINWDEEHEIGKIKTNSFLPKNEQTVYFKLIADEYQLRIEKNGKCYLKVLGSLPDKKDPVIIPVRAVYKKTKSKL